MIRVGILVLFLSLEEKLSVFLCWFRFFFAVDFLHMAFTMLRYISCTPNLLRVFNINVCWILSAFSVSIDDRVIFILHFVNMVYHINWLSYVEAFLYPRDKCHWLWCITFQCAVECGLLVFCWGFSRVCSSGLLAWYFLIL